MARTELIIEYRGHEFRLQPSFDGNYTAVHDLRIEGTEFFFMPHTLNHQLVVSGVKKFIDIVVDRDDDRFDKLNIVVRRGHFGNFYNRVDMTKEATLCGLQ